MQVNVLGVERRRRWSYDEKVRLVEETLQPRRDGLRGGAPARGGRRRRETLRHCAGRVHGKYGRALTKEDCRPVRSGKTHVNVREFVYNLLKDAKDADPATDDPDA